jgi:hypothetical protein
MLERAFEAGDLTLSHATDNRLTQPDRPSGPVTSGAPTQGASSAFALVTDALPQSAGLPPRAALSVVERRHHLTSDRR